MSKENIEIYEGEEEEVPEDPLANIPIDEVKKYNKLKNKNWDAPTNPDLIYLTLEVFPLVNEALGKMLKTAIENESIGRHRRTFNGVDFLAEYFWNKNTSYPQRKENWTYIFDMDWVKEYLKEHPRPFYPFFRLWTKDHAATKIQTFIRGYLARKHYLQMKEEERKRKEKLAKKGKKGKGKEGSAKSKKSKK